MPKGVREIPREIILQGPLYLEPQGRVDWPSVFGRRAPVLLDFGAARAKYFLSIGPKLPEVDLVGVEVAKKRVESALKKLELAGLGARARMIWGNAVHVLRDHVPEGSLAGITVLFPDPWPKKRHARRRIFQQPEIAELLARRIAPGGLLLFKTDAEAYFGPVRENLAACPLLEPTTDLWSRAEGFAPFSLDWPDETRYEEIWKSEGRSIFVAAFRRRAAPAPELNAGGATGTTGSGSGAGTGSGTGT